MLYCGFITPDCYHPIIGFIKSNFNLLYADMSNAETSSIAFFSLFFILF